MRAEHTIILVFALAVLAGLAALVLLAPSVLQGGAPKAAQSFSVSEIGRAGTYGYAVVSCQGGAKVRMLAYGSAPAHKVTIINDQSGIGMGKVEDFAYRLEALEKYGYEIELTDTKALGDGIFIVPTGAMPSYVLDDLMYNATRGTVVYIGKSDLVLRSDGVKQEAWLDRLTGAQKARLVRYDTTLDQMAAYDLSPFMQILLENGWAATGRSNYTLGEGTATATVGAGNGTAYARLIYEQPGGGVGIVDSNALAAEPGTVVPDSPSIFPWEMTRVVASVPRTNGTAIRRVYLNGQVYVKDMKPQEDVLQRAENQSLFVNVAQYGEPGDYVIKVDDNSGTIASGLLHVKNLSVSYYGSSGTIYLFNATLDGKPLGSEKVAVSLGNSTMKKDYYVSGGTLAVNAQLKEGVNTFNMELLGTTLRQQVAYSGRGIVEMYLTWGIPGLFLVLLVYFGARMARKPQYVVRFGEVAKEVRKEVRLTREQALDAFRLVRRDLGLGGSPITAAEYAVALKRYVTDGADVTEGNVEELLKVLARDGLLSSYRKYFQPAGEGDVRKNAIMREIREALIESGTPFRAAKDRFATDDFEIGLYGTGFTRKAIIIYDGKEELDRIFASLSERERALLRLQESNGVVEFVKIDRLGERL